MIKLGHRRPEAIRPRRTVGYKSKTGNRKTSEDWMLHLRKTGGQDDLCSCLKFSGSTFKVG